LVAEETDARRALHELQLRVREARFEHYLAKPYDLEQLDQLIAEVERARADSR
jgi:arsenate reductase-like glutaredoxin family protein